MELIRLGEMEGGLSKRVEKLAELWKDAGFNVKAFDDIQQLIWEKFICNVSFSAPCTVFDKTIGEVLDDPECWNVSRNCGLEAYNVGLQKEIHFSFDDPVKYIEAFGRNMPGARPSMLLDHMARRPSEIDAINGMVPVVAKEVGLRAPFNEALSAVVRIWERSF
jgi:2-dehydropantoate 2-reductase